MQEGQCRRTGWGWMQTEIRQSVDALSAGHGASTAQHRGADRRSRRPESRQRRAGKLTAPPAVSSTIHRRRHRVRLGLSQQEWISGEVPIGEPPGVVVLSHPCPATAFQGPARPSWLRVRPVTQVATESSAHYGPPTRAESH